MDLVRRAQRGELDHERLVAALMNWPFQPQYRTTGLADDWEFVEDSLDAVLFAFSLDMLSEEEFGAISRTDDDEIAAIVQSRDALESEPLSDVATRFGVDLKMLVEPEE
jgi:hypothetical protein